MLQMINRRMEKALPFIVPSSVIVGVLFAPVFVHYASFVPWVFALITFAGSLRLSFSALKQALFHPIPMITVLFLLHVFMPLWALGIGHLFFRGDHSTVLGLLLAVVIPTGVTSFIWVAILRGNLAFALAVILIDTFLSPFLVPGSLLVFAGNRVEIDAWKMMSGLFFMIIFPSLLGMIVNQWAKKETKASLEAVLSPVSKIALALVVMMNSAVVSPYLIHPNRTLFSIGFVVLLIASSGYFFSWMAARLLKFSQTDAIALTFTGGMRNISAGAVLAATYFPPKVSIPVVLGMLFQQVLASLYGKFLGKHSNRETLSSLGAIRTERSGR
ncbi:bile acid:sodium symporter family protein [Anoxybacillus sp. J5B_2022]|uniref:bile acid:sodium symporter family protein n=1 Tax=Anoxybacillus sp. J5B_2022 TaxID=3003246 RepID=UPI0022869878|nr:bile acid:sodium symporter family protein [Anoxybacillus sp. J5B_2022]MCZ0756598.1 bile acid:sodium symporter family protein [Anoxybacillus sp. J5B_2022]